MKYNERFIMPMFMTAVLFTTLTSCSKEEDLADLGTDVSITSAEFEDYTSYRDNSWTNIDFGVATNNNYNSIISVEGYKEGYDYDIKIVGEYLANEYSVDLSFDSDDEDGKTILKFDDSKFDAVPDTYQAYIVEENSDEELAITNSRVGAYKVRDSDHAEFLYELVFYEAYATTYALSSSFETTDTQVAISYPSYPNYSLGLDLELAVFDEDLNLLGKVDVSGNGNLSYSKTFDATDMDFITESGDYVFQLQGTPNDSNYTARNSTYITINVTYKSAAIVILK